MRTVLLLHGVESSRSTWWRVGQDLIDLGWDVVAVNLLGHGGRTETPATAWTVADLANDVAEQTVIPQFDLLIGHSLGAIVALALAALQPGYTRGVVIEDPPGLGGTLDPCDVATDVEQSVARARTEPAVEMNHLLEQNPSWAKADAEHSVDSRRALNVEQVTAFLRSNLWDLPRLVTDCLVPVHLLAASESGTALSDPDRSAVIAALPAGRVSTIPSGHGIHRDRPALWLNAVLSFAASLDIQ